MREITLMRMNDVVAILEYTPTLGLQPQVSVTYRDAERTYNRVFYTTPADEVVKDYQALGFNLYSDRTF